MVALSLCLWFEILLSWHGKPEERNHFEIFGDGTYIHWPDLDEDLTVAGLLAGNSPLRGESEVLKAMVKTARAKKA